MNDDQVLRFGISVVPFRLVQSRRTKADWYAFFIGMDLKQRTNNFAITGISVQGVAQVRFWQRQYQVTDKGLNDGIEHVYVSLMERRYLFQADCEQGVRRSRLSVNLGMKLP